MPSSRGETYRPRQAIIHCAYSQDQRQASVNYLSHEDSNWHGKCFVTEAAILLSFNARGDSYTDEFGQQQKHPMHASFLQYDRQNEAYTGFDYAGRQITMKLLETYVYGSDDGWQLVAA